MAEVVIHAEGARALDALAPRLAKVSDAEIIRPGTDPHAAAVTALLVSDYLGQRGVEVGDLGQLGRAVIQLVTKLGGEYLSDAKGVPGDLVQRGQAVRIAMLSALEKALGNDAEVVTWLEAIRLGQGIVDLVYDLRSLAQLATDKKITDQPIAQAKSSADAIEFALRAGESTDEAHTRLTLGKVWTLFEPAYESLMAAGRALPKTKGAPDFPPLVVVASHRRARRRPVSVVPPARLSVKPHAAVPSAPSPPRLGKPPPPLKITTPQEPITPISLPPSAVEEAEIIEVNEPAPEKRPGSIPPVPGAGWNEGRQSNRHVVELEVGIASDSNFYVGFTENLSAGGVFVATYNQKPIGSELSVVLTLPTGEELRVPGVVRWLRSPSPDSWPGMGVQFESLDAAQDSLIKKFLAMRDPLFYDD